MIDYNKCMKPRVANPTLADVLDQHTAVGTLCHDEDDRIRCVACGHRCLIGEGKRGICKVRYNEHGVLRVPFGYVAGLQCDPVEKKPFFHVHPSSDALTFGMMGCDLHCSYCFPGDTTVITNRGPLTFSQAFALATHVVSTQDGETAFPEGLEAVAASGKNRKVRGVFKHSYRGLLVVVRPYYLPPLQCTPDHRVYATSDASKPPEPLAASKLTLEHYLAIPRRYAFSQADFIDVADELKDVRVTYRVTWDLSAEVRAGLRRQPRGETSRQIAASLGKSPSYIRHVRSKIARGKATDARTSGAIREGAMVRFPNEHRPGIPAAIPLDIPFARLLGYYCAEGCVTSNSKRPNSLAINFSFSHQEADLVAEVCRLIGECLGADAKRVHRDTTLAVSLAKASAAHLFKKLAGGRSSEKRVPPQLFAAPREVIAAFLDAYCRGDGHRYANGKIGVTTVSSELAHGIAWLALKLGHLPSIYEAAMCEDGVIQGRPVKRSPRQFTVVWYVDSHVERKVIETDNYHLVPLREVSATDFSGDVFNMEVEDEHNYLAGFFLVCNCQNWVTSQALRDAAAVAPVRPMTPDDLVAAARREGARLVVSSYNEPLITAEWAVAVFEKAKAAGLDCAFVSNGNATPEVLDYLKPWIVAYKVDLKSFDDRHYRSLGGELANITDTIRMVHERGIWLEIVTLVIPGFNDSEGELREMARFLASVNRDIPWHVTAFHKDYRMTDPDATSPRTLMRAAEIGAAEGLRFIYAGNLPGKVGPWENTRCPGCGDTLIERYGYLIRAYRLTDKGCCPRCQMALPGIWPGERGAVRTGNDMQAYVKRLPRQVATVSHSLRSLPIVADTNSGGVPTMANPASPPQISDEQKQKMASAVGSLVRAFTHGQQAALNESALGGAGNYLIAGAFVSLKRGKHLRSCCGMMGQTVPLLHALQQAAWRTVNDDVRFPPVSPSEIDHLDMEVWLLHTPEPVHAKGAERAQAVIVGKHGIQVRRGDQHGLFLPSVAIDNEWDSHKFLNQVCVKAGMHPTAWLDDGTALFTFEGEVIRSPLSERTEVRAIERRPALCRQEDLAAYANFCGSNIGALLSGATPNYYLFGAADGDVNGVILALQRGGEATYFWQLSLRPGVPLQSTLYGLSQNAAQALAKQRPTPETLAATQVLVTILHDPVLHGTAKDADLAGFVPDHRALLVMERNKSAIVFNPGKSSSDLLAEAVKQAQVAHPAAAAVYSLDALAPAPFSISTAPKPIRGPAVRPPGAAGNFYPADAAQLARMVDGLFTGEGRAEAWPAAMLPHAGLQFSGRLAAAVLKRLQIPRTVIVIGPKHTPHGMDWAVAPHQTWSFPGGSLESDFMLARRLHEAIPGLEMDAAAHQSEHAIEVELPLLARLAPESRVVGIAIGSGDLESCRRFAAGLANVLKEREDRPLLLISSDMNHFATDTENRRLDAIALDALDRLDPAGVYETVTENQISMCGLLPAVIILETLRLLGGVTKTERVGYATSADVSGDKSRVVGYAGMLFA